MVRKTKIKAYFLAHKFKNKRAVNKFEKLLKRSKVKHISTYYSNVKKGWFVRYYGFIKMNKANNLVGAERQVKSINSKLEGSDYKLKVIDVFI